MSSRFSLMEILETRIQLCAIHAVDADTGIKASGFSARINFQPSNVPVPDFFKADTGAVYGVRANGLTYGWNADNSANARDRNSWLSADQSYDTLIHMQRNGDFKWEIAVPNGKYFVHVAGGDASYSGDTYRMRVEGVLTVADPTTSYRHWIEGANIVNVTDGRLTISNDTSRAVNEKICFVEISSVSDTAISWSKAASSPITRVEAQSGAINGKLYVLGGYSNGSWVPQSRSDVYNVSANTWSRVADMPEPLTHGGTEAVGTDIYIAGGYVAKADRSGQIFGTTHVWKYDTAHNSWARVAADLPSARGAGSMVLLGRELHFLGGETSSRIEQSTHWVLNLDNISAGWFSRASIPTAATHLGSAVVNGKIYVFGGQKAVDARSTYLRSAYVYDPSANSWTKLANMPVTVSHVAESGVVYNGKIIVLGGEIQYDNATNAVTQYDPATNSWTVLGGLPAPRGSGVAGVFGNKIIFTTGLAHGFFSDTYVGVIN